jgi:uncharacterized membrane protein HdeD (DUF308 family)
MGIKERMQQPKSKFFGTLSKVGLVIAAVGGALLGAPVVLPAVLIQAAGYLVVAGGVMSAVSELSVGGE